MLSSFSLSRVAAADSKFESQQLPQLCKVPQDGTLSTGSKAHALSPLTDIGVELILGIGENKDGSRNLTDATLGYVNTNDCPERLSSELDIVNNRDRENPKIEALVQVCK